MKRKRILHFHTSGLMAAIFVLPLIELEREQKCDSRIITSNHPLKSIGGLAIPFDLTFRNLFFLPYVFIKLCFYIYQFRPNLIISHNFKSSLLPLLAARLMGVPLRIYFNHGVPYVGYQGFYRALLRWLEALNISLATEVITVSEDMKKLLLDTNSQKTVSLIANGSACGIDLIKHSANNYNHHKFLKKYRLNDDDFIVTYIGRPEIRKGFKVVLELWLKYFQVQSKYKLILCGPSEEDVLKLMGTVPKNVYCLGFIENIPEILSNSDCLILSSFHEGLPYAVLEAMASGCISLVNSIPGISNLVHDKVNGFIVKDNSLEIFAELILYIDEAPKCELKQIKDEAIKTADKYSRDIFLEAYKCYILNLLNTIKVSYL